MPILEGENFVKPGENLPVGLAAEIAERAGALLAASAGQTWVKVRALPAEAYAESGGGPPHGIYPVFVTILKARRPEPHRLQAEVAGLTQAIANACKRPAENVHILYLPDGAGRVAFGGQIVPE